jgi:hypothetical protein
MSHDDAATSEIKTRIALTPNAFKQLSNVWRSKPFINKTKLSLFNSCILSVLTYGCESWKSTKLIEEKLNAFGNKCLRKIGIRHSALRF